MRKKLFRIAGALLLSAWAAMPASAHHLFLCDLDIQWCYDQYTACFLECYGYIENFECYADVSGCIAECWCSIPPR